MNIPIYLLIFVLSYLFGSFPTAYFLVKKVMGKDIRKFETGNVGAMNTARMTGKFQYFLVVLFGDAFKGYLALVVAKVLIGANNPHLLTAYSVAAFAVVLGHCYSAYFKVKDGKFVGGKGVATMAGVLLYLNWLYLLVPIAIIMLLIIVVSRNLFASQFFAALILPLLALIWTPQYFVLLALCMIPVLSKQWPRVIPMFRGEEPKLYWGKKQVATSKK